MTPRAYDVMTSFHDVISDVICKKNKIRYNWNILDNMPFRRVWSVLQKNPHFKPGHHGYITSPVWMETQKPIKREKNQCFCTKFGLFVHKLVKL